MTKNLIALLLLTTSFCYSADQAFEGQWLVNVPLTKSQGFPGEAWDIASNKALVEAVSSMEITIAGDAISFSVTSNNDKKADKPKVILRSDKQIVLESSNPPAKLSMLTLLTEGSLVMESGQFFRVYFKKR